VGHIVRNINNSAFQRAAELTNNDIVRFAEFGFLQGRGAFLSPTSDDEQTWSGPDVTFGWDAGFICATLSIVCLCCQPWLILSVRRRQALYLNPAVDDDAYFENMDYDALLAAHAIDSVETTGPLYSDIPAHDSSRGQVPPEGYRYDAPGAAAGIEIELAVQSRAPTAT
jgi:hypothetical protein